MQEVSCFLKHAWDPDVKEVLPEQHHTNVCPLVTKVAVAKEGVSGREVSQRRLPGGCVL